MPSPLSLPALQNWSCHSCGNCCRHHQINISETEHQRILDQKWTAADGVPPGEGAFKKSHGAYHLAHQPDGACVFLDANNRCRIHARFGEAAKPLACRTYPFVFHPTGHKSIAIGLRFDCPSAAANRGAPLSQQRRELQILRDLVVPADRDQKPPKISDQQLLDWDDTLRIIARLRALVCEDNAKTPLGTRLVHALFVAGMLGRATFDKIRGQRLDELLDTLITCAPLETVASLANVKEPSSLAKTEFRLTVAQYTAQDTTTRSGIGYRLGKALAGFRFARGRGQTPAMGPGLAKLSFAALELPAQGSTPEIDALLVRYFDVKLSGMGFCGLGCFGMSVVEGFQNLILLHPVILYIARWLAHGRGETHLAPADVERALTIVDHHHARSPIMAWPNFRNRIRRLADQDEISKLIAWYGR